MQAFLNKLSVFPVYVKPSSSHKGQLLLPESQDGPLLYQRFLLSYVCGLAIVTGNDSQGILT